MVTDTTALKSSVIMTAVLAEYMSPGRVRVYRNVSITNAFCNVKMNRLQTFMDIEIPPKMKFDTCIVRSCKNLYE